jgi:hypothetical protein
MSLMFVSEAGLGRTTDSDCCSRGRFAGRPGIELGNGIRRGDGGTAFDNQKSKAKTSGEHCKLLSHNITSFDGNATAFTTARLAIQFHLMH